MVVGAFGYGRPDHIDNDIVAITRVASRAIHAVVTDNHLYMNQDHKRTADGRLCDISLFRRSPQGRISVVVVFALITRQDKIERKRRVGDLRRQQSPYSRIRQQRIPVLHIRVQEVAIRGVDDATAFLSVAIAVPAGQKACAFQLAQRRPCRCDAHTGTLRDEAKLLADVLLRRLFPLVCQKRQCYALCAGRKHAAGDQTIRNCNMFHFVFSFLSALGV